MLFSVIIYYVKLTPSDCQQIKDESTDNQNMGPLLMGGLACFHCCYAMAHSRSAGKISAAVKLQYKAEISRTALVLIFRLRQSC